MMWWAGTEGFRRPEGRGQCGLIRMQWVTDGDAGDGCNKDEGLRRRGKARGQCGLIRRRWVSNVIISTNSIISIQIAAIYMRCHCCNYSHILNNRHIECVFHLCGKSAEKNRHQLAAHLLLGWKWMRMSLGMIFVRKDDNDNIDDEPPDDDDGGENDNNENNVNPNLRPQWV